MGNILAVAVIVSAVALSGASAAAIIRVLADRFRQKPLTPVSFTPPPGPAGRSREEVIKKLIAEAQASIGMDPINHYNIAIAGPSGCGKSSLINYFLGLKPTDPRAANVGVTETTQDKKRYDHPDYPFLKIWDLPGAGTSRHPAQTYFEDEKLYAFDIILLASASRFQEVGSRITEQAILYNKPVAFLWLKADIDLANLQSDFDLTEEDAIKMLRESVESSFRREITNSQTARFFIISTRDLQKGKILFDELAFLRFVEEITRARTTQNS